ncbi:MAG: extracellular solute-binding protein [Anaerolineales bacterium]|nr:extracellular solute-binding protein [Anaerolineales bacterium]
MKRTLFVLASMVLVASMVLTACAPTSEAATEAVTEAATEAPTEVITEEPMPALTGTVTLWHGWKDNEIESLNEVIAAFQALNPEVQFDILYVPFDDLRGKYETAAATGGGPALLIGAADWGPALYDAALIADVSSLISAETINTINPAALGAVQYNDALIGLPQTLKGVVMYRNTAIVPEASATFDELVVNAQAATTGDIFGAYLEYGFFFSAGTLSGVGGSLMTPEGDPAFNDANGIAWVDLIARFPEAGPATNNTDDDVNLFKAGQAGIIIDGTWNIASLAEAIGAENLAIDPWPAPLSGYVQTENIYFNGNVTGDDAAASLAFMEFFLSPEAQSILADPTKAAHIPAIAGVEVSDPLMQQAVAAFAGGAAFPVIPEMGAYWDPMNNMLLRVLNEGADPAAALQDAFDAVTAKVAEIRGE